MLTIELPPELENALNLRARNIGKTPEQYALDTLQQRLAKVENNSQNHQDWVNRLKLIGSDAGVSLAEEALSREAIYD